MEQPGFQKVTKTGIQVNINQAVRTDFTLAIGAVTQTVTVEAVATAIKTDDATVSESIGTRAVAELPLNGRDPMRLAITTPGVLLGPIFRHRNAAGRGFCRRRYAGNPEQPFTGWH